MQDLKVYLRDWKFYFKLIFGLFFAAVLLYHWLNPLINGINVTDEQKADARNWEWFTQDKGDYTLNFVSFFTIQTNIMVVLWLIFSAIYHKQEGKTNSKWFGTYMALGITTFITITFIVFNTMLLPTPAVLNQTTFFFWFTNVIEHMVVPIIMIVYFVFFMNKEKGSVLSNKMYWQKHLLIYYSYPIIWLFIMLVRGEFRYQAGKVWAYQYFFINIHKTSFGLAGWIWLIIAAVFIILIIFGISTLFNSVAYKQQIQSKSKK